MVSLSFLILLSISFTEGEIDYVRVLNRVLPNDIRVLGWCPVPIGFSARFVYLFKNFPWFSLWICIINFLVCKRILFFYILFLSFLKLKYSEYYKNQGVVFEVA